MDRLQRQRDELTTKLEGERSSERLTEIGEQLRQIVRDLDAAENTWLELSERAEQYALQRKG
jgi:DNA-binding HxlR family transcriptional regulator